MLKLAPLLFVLPLAACASTSASDSPLASNAVVTPGGLEAAQEERPKAPPLGPVPAWVGRLAAAEGPGPAPAPANAVSIPGDGAMNLVDLVQLYGAAMGGSVYFTTETEQQLRNTSITLEAGRVIAPDRFQGFFQSLFHQHELALFWMDAGAPPVFGVQSLSTGRSAAGLRSKALFVDAADLAAYADQHALLIETVLDLPGIDTRQLSTSLRSLLTDTNTQNLISADAHSLIVQGFGSQLVELGRMLASIEESARAKR